MSLNLTIELIAFNSDLQRFADIYGDSIETEDIQDIIKRFWAIVPLKALKVVTADSVGDAFDYLDSLAQETQAEALRNSAVFQGKTIKGLEELAKINYSINKGWFEDWQEFESELINYLPNMTLKNYIPLDTSDNPRANMYSLRARFAETVGDLLFEDIQGLECDIVERFAIIKRFAEEFEPNFKESEFAEVFESGLKAKTWGELFEFVADWVNTLVIVTYGSDGEIIEGETSPRDYLYLLGGLVAWA